MLALRIQGVNIMGQTKNLCAPVPLSLHARVLEEKERTGETLG